MKTGIPVLFLFVSLFALSSAKIDPDNLMCLVCRATVNELEDSIRKIDPKKTVEVGNYRLDTSGNIHQNKVPLSKSQVHISEMLDSVCSSMSDYVRVKYKATGKLAVMRMMVDGRMNPEFSLTDFVTDEDLNKSLEFYCDSILGENEDFIVDLYSKRPTNELPDGKSEICEKQLKFCKDWMYTTAEDLDWTPKKQQEYLDKYGPDPYGFGGMAPPPSAHYGDGEAADEMDASQLEMKEEL